MPIGCSAQTNGDWAAHFKSFGNSDCNSGYRLVCSGPGIAGSSSIPPLANHDLDLSQAASLIEKCYRLSLSFASHSVADGSQTHAELEVIPRASPENMANKSRFVLKILATARAYASCERSGLVRDAAALEYNAADTVVLDHNRDLDATFSVDVFDFEGMEINDTKADITASWVSISHSTVNNTVGVLRNNALPNRYFASVPTILRSSPGLYRLAFKVRKGWSNSTAFTSAAMPHHSDPAPPQHLEPPLLLGEQGSPALRTGSPPSVSRSAVTSGLSKTPLARIR